MLLEAFVRVGLVITLYSNKLPLLECLQRARQPHPGAFVDNSYILPGGWTWCSRRFFLDIAVFLYAQALGSFWNTWWELNLCHLSFPWPCSEHLVRWGWKRPRSMRKMSKCQSVKKPWDHWAQAINWHLRPRECQEFNHGWWWHYCPESTLSNKGNMLYSCLFVLSSWLIVSL